LGYDVSENLLWAMLRDRRFRGRIDHCFVENELAKFPELPFNLARFSPRPPAGRTMA
jgi:hypothetical protein